MTIREAKKNVAAITALFVLAAPMFTGQGSAAADGVVDLPRVGVHFDGSPFAIVGGVMFTRERGVYVPREHSGSSDQKGHHQAWEAVQRLCSQEDQMPARDGFLAQQMSDQEFGSVVQNFCNLVQREVSANLAKHTP